MLQNRFVKEKKAYCALTLLSLAWWLLMHDHIKTLCFKPPISFPEFMPLSFGLSFQCQMLGTVEVLQLQSGSP